MIFKQAYELTIDDIIHFGAWHFPMNETVDDELTVIPLTQQELCSDLQAIIRTKFMGINGDKYLGYLYWNSTQKVNHLKPVILLNDGSSITFWNGLIKPSWQDYSTNAQSMRTVLPISYSSESILDLPVISGTLEGLYYLDGENICKTT